MGVYKEDKTQLQHTGTLSISASYLIVEQVVKVSAP